MAKKMLVSVVMLLCLVSVVFAQAEKEGAIVVTEDYVGNVNAEKVLTVAINRDDTIRSPYESRVAYIEEAAMKWAEAHPEWGIELKVLTPGQISQDMARLLTEAEQGVAPDFIHLDSFWVGNFLDAGLLQPIDPYITQADKDAFFDWTKGVTMRDGKQYAIWGETDARLLYYRKDLIDTPPRTWDDLIEAALMVQDKYGIKGFLTPAGQSESASNENTWAYFWAQGGEIFGENSRPVLGEGENRQKLINVYAFMKRLIDTGASPKDIISMTGFDPIMSEVRADNVGLIIQGTWAVSQINDIVEDADEKWDFVPYPQMDADTYANSNGGWTWAVLTEDKEKQEVAMSYIMSMVGSKDAMAARAKAFNYIPTRSDVFESDSYFSDDPIQQRFFEELKNGHARPASSLYPTISGLNARMMGEVLIGNKTPAEAVDELQRLALVEWEEWLGTQN